jgi:hypothetical protein
MPLHKPYLYAPCDDYDAAGVFGLFARLGKYTLRRKEQGIEDIQ